MVLLVGAQAPGVGETAVQDLDEVFRSPVRGVAWRAKRDETTGRKWFESPTGEQVASPGEIVAREVLELPPLERVVESELARAATDPARADEFADVTIVFRRQTAYEAGVEARARYAPRFAVPLARSREIVASLANRRADPDGRADPVEDERLLTDDEKSALRASRDEVHALLAAFRREVSERASAEAALDQRHVVRWIEAQPGARVHTSSWILSTVSARLPLEALPRLVEGFPEVGRVERVRSASPTLDASVSSISAGSWWIGGIDGSSTTKVAVLDTGVDSGHPALSVANAAVNLATAASTDPWFADSTTSTDDLYGHGTHVAGIACSTDSTRKGVAPGAGLMNAKCGYSRTGGGANFQLPDVYAAADWAAQNGAYVMNASFGGGGTNDGSSSDSLFFDAAVHDLAIAVAISAGNSGSSSGSVGIPGDAFNILSVGAFDDRGTTSLTDDALASFSSRGPTADGRRRPDLAAPGVAISSASHVWEGSASDWINQSGTSMAAPHTAGALALLFDYGTSWAPEALKALLLTTARNTSPVPTSPDNNWGWGALDLGAAYTYRAAVLEGTSPLSGAGREFVEISSLPANRRVTLVWNRNVTSNRSSVPVTSYPLIDLDLYLYDATTGASRGSSVSAVNPVEQIKTASALTPAVVKIDLAGSVPTGILTDSYALAAETTGTLTRADPPALACTFTQEPPSFVYADQDHTVIVTVTNSGDLPAFAPQVTLALPAGYTVQGGAARTLGTIAADASAAATFVVRATAGPGGTKSLSAVASSASFGETFSSLSASATHTLDDVAPTGSVNIEGGAGYTRVADVTLALAATDGSGIDAMRLRDAGGSWGAWGPFASTRAWTLPAEGVATVEAEYRDVAGNVLRVADAITYDAVAPVGSAVLGSGGPYTNERTLPLYLTATDATSGVAEQRFGPDEASLGEWQPYGTANDVDLGAAEGTATRVAQFRDFAGNLSAAVSASVVRDVTSPTASIEIEGGAAAVNRSNVLLAVTAADNLTGVPSMRFSTNGTNWTSWVPFAPQVGAFLTTPDAVNTVYAQIRDGAGNVSATATDTIFVDATGPSGSIGIAGDARFTASRDVTLALSAQDASSGVAGMRLRNEGDAWGEWQALAATSTWTLAEGEGLRTVFVQYRDGAGNLSAEYQATITRDTTPPFGDVTILSGATAVNHADVAVQLAATDSASGVVDLRVRNDDGSWTAWQPVVGALAFDLAPGEGVRRVFVEYRDAVGNVSAASVDDILVDLTPPSGGLVVARGAALLLPWDPLAAEPTWDDGALGSGVVSVEFSDDAGVTWTEPTLPGAVADLGRPAAVAEGPVSVLARFRDLAGNVSEPVAAGTNVVAAPAQGLESVKRLDGVIAAGGDIDAYTVELIEGDVLSIRLVARAAARGADFGVELDLYDPERRQVVDDRWPVGARKPGIAKFVAPSTGTYVVLVAGSGRDADAGGGYSLSTRTRRNRAIARTRGTIEAPTAGSAEPPTIAFTALQGGTIGGAVRVLINTPLPITVIGPDGTSSDFLIVPRRGSARLAALPLTSGTGEYVLRLGNFAPSGWSLRLGPPAPTSRRGVEIPPPGQR